MSVIELMAAVAILSVSVLMIISCFFGVSSFGTRIRDYTYARIETVNLFESVRAEGAGQYCSSNSLTADKNGIYLQRINRHELMLELKIKNGETLSNCEIGVYSDADSAYNESNEIFRFSFQCCK